MTRRGMLFLYPLIAAAGASAGTQALWPDGMMPDPQPHQIAARAETAAADGFSADAHRYPFLSWSAPPSSNAVGVCMLLVSGGGYQNLCDGVWVDRFADYLTARGVQCVSLVYRTPRPKGAPIYRSGWQDGQRAVRLVRRAAAARGYDPEKIGALGFSAGGHLTLLLALSSRTPAYGRIDATDDLPCHVNFAVPVFPAYVLSDGVDAVNTTKGHGPGVTVNPCFAFDGKTCPLCLIHGSDDVFSPIGSVAVYRRLHEMGVSSDLHLYANRGHGFMRADAMLRDLGRWIDRVGDFVREWDGNRRRGRKGVGK